MGPHGTRAIPLPNVCRIESLLMATDTKQSCIALMLLSPGGENLVPPHETRHQWAFDTEVK